MEGENRLTLQLPASTLPSWGGPSSDKNDRIRRALPNAENQSVPFPAPSGSAFTAALFYRITGVGNVGVLPGDLAEHLKVFSFVTGGTNTGLAMANPSETEQSQLLVRIFDSSGTLQREVETTLGPRHQALFLSQEPYLVEQDGSVDIWASQPVVAVTLRLEDNLLSSAPVITPAKPRMVFYQRSATMVIPTFKEQRIEATCNEGDFATGGGYECEPVRQDGGSLLSTTDPRYSAPAGENGWKAFWNSNNQPLNCTVFVKCVSATP